MKKHNIFNLLIIGLVLLFTSCSEELGQPSNPIKKTNASRTLEEIISIAENAPSIFEPKSATRGTISATKKVDISSIQALNASGRATRASSEESSIFAINYQDQEGYVLVSAKANTPAVIAYIEEGQYDLDEIRDKRTDIGFVVDMANAYISNLSPADIIEITPGDAPDTVAFYVGPYLTTKWGQRDPEGRYCPNHICGCAATAMAQLMAFYEYPDTMSLTYEDADKSLETFNWTEIKRHTVRHTINGSFANVLCLASTETHNTIGRLCRQLGHLFNSTYKDDATSTQPPMMLSVAGQLGFTLESNYWKAYNDTCTIAPIDRAHPLLVVGYGDVGGHVWLVDGTIDMRITTVVHLVGNTTQTIEKREIYNHVNWGWDGKSNGYILSSIFDTSKLFQADNSPHGFVNGEIIFNRGIVYSEVYTTLPPFIVH